MALSLERIGSKPWVMLMGNSLKVGDYPHGMPTALFEMALRVK
jgi:hypothetical protein